MKIIFLNDTGNPYCACNEILSNKILNFTSHYYINDIFSTGIPHYTVEDFSSRNYTGVK